MITLRALRVANIARQAEWDVTPGGLDLAYRGNELAGEVGEACNVIKKLERERRGIRGSRATVAQLAAELSDVVICADLIAMAEGIDLDAAIVEKFNATSAANDLKTRLPLPADHGTGQDAIDFILDSGVDCSPSEVALFLTAWREGDLDEWPEFHQWLDGRRRGAEP